MGKSLSQEEQSLSDSLNQDYIVHDNQFIVSRRTGKQCTLHRIETTSKQQTLSIHNNIQQYRKIQCNSISRLYQHFEIDNSGYCTDSSKFYLVFEGYEKPNVKQEYFYRRYASQPFMSQQIEAVLSAMLCAIRHYYFTFNRKQTNLNLQSVIISNVNNTLQLKDPWLLEKQNKGNSVDQPINFLASYPSPQKIVASNQTNLDYDEFKSDLFSVGVFGLQFINMNYRDDLYIQKKFVDRCKVYQNLSQIQNGRLRDGLAILLSEDPNQRANIYQYWDIRCDKQYKLNKVNVAPQNIQLQNSQVQIIQNNGHQQLFPLRNQIIQIQNNNKVQFLNTSNVSQTRYNYGIPAKLTNNNLSGSQFWRPESSAVTQTSPVHFNNANMPISNVSNNVIKNVNINMKSSQIEIVPPLARQFSKPLQIKNGRNQLQGKVTNVYRKKPNVNFQQPTPAYDFNKAKFANANMNTETKREQPSPQKQPVPYNIGYLNPSTNPNTNHNSAISNTLGNPSGPISQNTYSAVPSTSSININAGNSLQKSFQTPRFNFQSPSTQGKNSTAAFGYMQNSLNNNKDTITSSFNASNAYQNNMYQSYGQYNSQPTNPINPQPTMNPIIPNINNININIHNTPIVTVSPTKNIDKNSPILTKSIISSSDQPQQYAKMSSQQNTQMYSNSLRQTKNVSQNDRNSIMSGYNLNSNSNMPLPSSIKVDVSRQDTKSPIYAQRSPIKTQKSLSPLKYPQQSIPTPIQPLKPEQPQTVQPQQHSLPTPPPNPLNPLINPSSLPNGQSTPPPAPRYPNKYNSTIVQVNQQTPNQSQESSREEHNDIEFIIEEYDTGSRYEGYKKKGLRHGRGKFYYQDGGYYDGEWKKNQMHGWGKLYYEGGQLAYEGEWAHDQFHGYGKVYNDNPVSLEGGFDYTNFDLLDDYWEFYEGMLANDTKEGRGRIQLTNKQVFQGDFHADRIQGFGKFLRRDGNIVQGIWRDSRLIKVLTSNDIYK